MIIVRSEQIHCLEIFFLLVGISDLSAQVTDTNDLSVPYREIWKWSVVSQDRNSVPPNGFD